MTTPPTSAPNPTSSSLNERQWTLLERIVAKDSFLLSKMSDREVADAYALLNEGLIDYDFDESRFVSDQSSREALAAHAAPVPVVAPDLIAKIVAALETARDVAIVDFDCRPRDMVAGRISALDDALRIVRQIAGVS